MDRTCLSFCDWFTSLSVMPSRSIHVAAGIGVSFWFKSEYYSIMREDHTWFILLHQLILLFVPNKAAMMNSLYLNFCKSDILHFSFYE